MPITNESATIVFANSAGAARSEQSNLEQLGQYLNEFLTEEKLLDGIVAVGLSEVIVSIKSPPRCTYPASTELLSPYEPKVHLDDLNDFRTGFKRNALESCYFSHVNSRDHRHPAAVAEKWGGSRASRRIANEFGLLRDVYQGTGALLFASCKSCDGLQLRPAGEYPIGATTDDPLEYRGNRDSEPRAAIVVRELSVADDLTVDLVFCQLETNSRDKRVGTQEELESSRGVEHRIVQIDALCNHLRLNEGRPVILMGDFNARPGSKELDYLCEKYGFLQILPEGIPSLPAPANTWGKTHVFGSPNVDRPNYAQSEADQGWPHSHLEHRILIDHAFVKGLPDQWSCDLKVIQLSEESTGKRVSDHRPIALTIKRKSQELINENENGAESALAEMREENGTPTVTPYELVEDLIGSVDSSLPDDPDSPPHRPPMYYFVAEKLRKQGLKIP